MDLLFLHVNHDAGPMLIINIDGKVNVLQIENIILRCLLLPSSNVFIIVSPTKCCIDILLIKQILKKLADEPTTLLSILLFASSHVLLCKIFLAVVIDHLVINPFFVISSSFL
jgi:hypothetical protein